MRLHGRPEEGDQHIWLAYAHALYATGADDVAVLAINDAEAHLLEIAGKIQDPRWRSSFLEAVPENAETIATARKWRG